MNAKQHSDNAEFRGSEQTHASVQAQGVGEVGTGSSGAASGPIDALAVFAELIDFEERHAEYERRANYEAREARAAFAELVHKARSAARALEGSGDWQLRSHGRMLMAALARIGTQP